MATMPVRNTPDAIPIEGIEQRFRHLSKVWEAETLFFSDPERIIGHPAFQEIIALGEAVVPLLLRELEKGPSLWVWALSRITGDNPTSPEDGGNIGKMSEAWLRWGRAKGLRW